MKFSLGEGKPIIEAPEGLQVVYENILLPGSKVTTADLYIYLRPEGISMDVVFNEQLIDNDDSIERLAISTIRRTPEDLAVEVLESSTPDE